MSNQLIFLPEAREDIFDAYTWYEEQSLGLGLDFLRCVESLSCTIARNPLMYPSVYEGYRRALVRRFPYAVFYEVSDGQIIVYSVFHCSRDPGKWRGRLA
jgi:plasmid stabilization system protein ParE